MREVLNRLDIGRTNKAAHHNHFHIFIRAPQIRGIEPSNNLLVDNAMEGQTQGEADTALRE